MNKKLVARKGRNPWLVVVAVFLIQTITGGIGFFVFPVFLESIQDEFGWSVTKISSAFLVWGIVGAIFSPIIGKWVDRAGAQKVMFFGTALQCILTFAMGYIGNIGHLYALMGLFAIASICNTYIPVSFLIAQWFVKHRGAATGLAMLGLGAGGALMPQIASELLTAHGWRAAYSMLAGVVALGFFPIVLWGRGPKEGEAEVEPDISLEEHQATDITLEGSLRTRSFWGICMGDALAGLVVAIFNAHLILYLTGTLGSDKIATDVYSVMQLGLLGGTMLFAIIADHFSIPRMMIFCYAMPALASGILLFTGSLPMAMLFAVCCGIPLGGRQALFPVALSYSFGPTHLAAIYGLNNSFFFLGIAFGPIIGGMIYDGTGQNTAAVYATAMVLFALSGCLIALMRRETSDGRRRTEEVRHWVPTN